MSVVELDEGWILQKMRKIECQTGVDKGRTDPL